MPSSSPAIPTNADPAGDLKALLVDDLRRVLRLKRARRALDAPPMPPLSTYEALAGAMTLPYGQVNRRDVLGGLVAYNGARRALVPGSRVPAEHTASVERVISDPQYTQALLSAVRRDLAHAHHSPAVRFMDAHMRENAKRSHVCIDLPTRNTFIDTRYLGVTMFVYKEYDYWRPPFLVFARQSAANQVDCVSTEPRVLYRWVGCLPPDGVCGAMSAHTDENWVWGGGGGFKMRIHLKNSISLPVAKYTTKSSTGTIHGEEVIFPGTLTRRSSSNAYDYDHTSDQYVGYVHYGEYHPDVDDNPRLALPMIFVGADEAHVQAAIDKFGDDYSSHAVIPPATVLLREKAKSARGAGTQKRVRRAHF